MRKFTLLFAFLIFAFYCFGQWSVGPKVGINFHTITGKWSSDDESKYRFVTGPVAGAVGSYSFSDAFALNAELVYITMGRKVINSLDEKSSNQLMGEGSFKTRWKSIQMVILGNYNFLNNIILILALYSTFKINGVLIYPDGTRIDTKIGEDPSRDDGGTIYYDPKYNRRWDFGMYVGGGYKHELGPGTIVADLRFGYGFLDLNKFEDKDQKKEAKDNGYKGYHSMNISLAVAYMFQLGKNK